MGKRKSVGVLACLCVLGMTQSWVRSSESTVVMKLCECVGDV